MKKIKNSIIILFLMSLPQFAQGIIINHNCTKLDQIPESAILQAKNNLHIAYGHTSHGSQIITGMNNLDNFMGNTGLYEWNDGPREGYLDIDDYFMSGDLGNPDRTTWAERTREYLNNSNNSDVNVVMWSWCGQASSASEEDINTYLGLMSQLEIDYPNVLFVYMTGHLDGSGLTGNLHLRNEQIRNYCINNNKVLFDFADIECYDPDGNYFGDKIPNDNCDYDTDGNGSRDGNWAIEWQNSHTEGVDWYSCSSAHSQALNSNQKAYAAWWLWATLTGWEGSTTSVKNNKLPYNITLNNNYPNPFNPSTIIDYSISALSAKVINEGVDVQITVYDILGNKIATLFNGKQIPGNYNVEFNSKGLASGTYLYRLSTNDLSFTKSMILIK